MRVPTRILMMSRVSRHRGTLRHSSSSIVGLPHIDVPLPSALCPLLPASATLPFGLPFFFFFFFFILQSSGHLCVLYFNPGCYHLFSRCVVVVVVVLCYHPQILSNLTALHSFTPPFPSLCYAHFIYSPRSLTFIFILYHSSRGGTTCYYSTRLLHFS